MQVQVVPKITLMKYFAYIILFFTTLILASSCQDQERVLYDRYIDLSEPEYRGDTVRMNKILSIHKKLYRRNPDNLIYLSNVFQSNCALGNFKENQDLIENSILPDEPNISSRVHKHFYLALNMYRQDPKSNYHQHLRILLDEDLSHNPPLGYIAARCLGKEKIADEYYPQMMDYIFEMPEKKRIIKMIESDRCDRFLELYRGICPVCEICLRRNFI